MKDRMFSAKLSLGICIFFAVLLVVSAAAFPWLIRWFYVEYHHLDPLSERVTHNLNTVTVCFYCCVPFAAAALYMLIRLLRGVLKNDVFVMRNVRYLRLISWCCYAVALITGAGGLFYLPLVIIAAAMLVVGTLLRVVKNVIHAAVALREENELTI